MVAEVLTSHRFPPAAAARVCAELLNRHSAHEIACAIEVLIDLRDIMDGDADAETEGLEDDFTAIPTVVDFGPGCVLADAAEEDDPQGACDEDEVSSALASVTVWSGPGCPIADPAEGREDWIK